MCRAIIADKCVVSNAGLRLMLSDAVGFTDVEGLAGSTATVKAIEAHRPVILVINITTIGIQSFDILTAVHTLSPRTRILVFDNDFTGSLLVRFLKLGIHGYCTGNAHREELRKAFKYALQGKQYLCRESSAYLLTTTTSAPVQHIHEQFSERELQIFLMLGSGKKSSEIAEALSLSRQAVSTYRSRIQQKSNMRSGVDIAQYIQLHQLAGTDRSQGNPTA